MADGRSSSCADDKIRRVVLCSGKVYYDLFEEREKRGIDDVYLLRVEQLYPFPLKTLVTELARFKNAEVVWCQEEPKNMGAWTFVDPYLEWVLDQCDSRAKRAALRRPPGLRRDRDGPDVEASGPAEGLPGRGVRGRGLTPLRPRSRSRRTCGRHRCSDGRRFGIGVEGGLVVIRCRQHLVAEPRNGAKSPSSTAARITSSTRWLRGMKAGLTARMAARRCSSPARLIAKPRPPAARPSRRRPSDR